MVLNRLCLSTNIDKLRTSNRLKEGLIYPEIEGFAISIQDQQMNTRNYKKYILKDSTITTDKYRKCNIQTETIVYITAGCQIPAAVDYTNRHNNFSKYIIPVYTATGYRKRDI